LPYNRGLAGGQGMKMLSKLAALSACFALAWSIADAGAAVW
jgi:hypothetical protein